MTPISSLSHLAASFAFLACVSSALAGCGSENGLNAGTNAVVAEAIDGFADAYAEHVQSVSFVVVPRNISTDDVQASVTSDIEVAHERPVDAAYWRVHSVDDRGNYWEVVMSWSEGAGYFEGPVFLVERNGDLEVTSPASVGATPVTAVS